MIMTQNDFEDETEWEKTVLELAVPAMPLTASGADLDLRTNTITMVVPSIVSVSGAVGDLLNRVLPLLFGAAWKILDLAHELAFANSGLTPQNGRKWTFEEKSRHAAAHNGILPGIISFSDIWQAIGSLYYQRIEVRHALVHRRVQVDPTARDLIGLTRKGSRLPALSYGEQMAFCRFSQRLAQAIIEGAVRPRVEADLRSLLAILRGHHGIPIHSVASTRPPVRVIDNFPGTGQLDVPHLLARTQETFPGAQYIHLELRLADGRILVGELDSAPQSIATIDPAVPPSWLRFI